MPRKILSSDLLIADVITPLDGNARLAALVQKHALKPGGKTALARDEFEEFTAAVTGYPVTLVPGGSSANMLTTLSKLMEGQIGITFVGVIGEGFSSTMIRESLQEAHIALIPQTLPPGITPKTGMSYVITYPDGQRTIATYPGNARDIITPDMITPDLIAAHDIILVQGSLWQKFDPAVADRLTAQRLTQQKKLWLALPTYSKYANEKARLFTSHIPNANLLLGNEEELCRIYQAQDAQKALARLQADFQKTTLHENGWRGSTRQVGFITRGESGAAIVTADRIENIAPAHVKNTAIQNTLGAGDTSFAGFAYGYLKGFPDQKSAQIAMRLAAEKLKVYGSRLDHPLETLRNL